MVTELATNEKKQKAKAANEAFWERFQFLLWINDDIICQRYFRINGYNRDMCHTEEFTTVMENCVRMIQDDLKYKSFILQSYTCDCPIKLTGFVNDPASESDVFLLSNPNISGNVTLSDGRTVEKTYFEYPDGTPEMHYMDNETLEPWDVVFKFQFLIDDKTVYERIWDGTQYPKYVRNSVDLTNSNAAYRDKDPQNLNFSASLQKHMTFGRKDLTYHIIKSIIGVLSWKQEDYERESTLYDTYGDTTYALRPQNKSYIDGWRSATNQKTRKHAAQIDKSERYSQYGGMTEGEWNYIEKRL